MKVLLVADREDWILGAVARNVSLLLSDYMQVNVVYSSADTFYTRYDTLQSGYDVVHFLSPWDFYALENRTYIPCVATLWHTVSWDPFEAHIKRADTLCVTSRQWYGRVTSHVSNDLPVQRIRFGLDTSSFKRDFSVKSFLSEKRYARDNALVFGFAGKASSNEGDRKGLDRLWACLIRLKTYCDLPFVLRILGPDWPVDIIPRELRAHTVFCSQIPIEGPLLSRFYSGLDYYVCTSREEGGPYPVLEAMSCQCVVLSTPVGIVPEVLKHGENGFLLRESSIETDFVDAVKCTIDESVRQEYGRMARQAVVEAFDWTVAIKHDEMEKMYNSAIRFYRSRPVFQRSVLAAAKITNPHLARLRMNLRLGTRLKGARRWLLGRAD